MALELAFIGGTAGRCRHYDLAVVPGVVRRMSLGFASNEVLGVITHGPLA